MLYIVIKSSDSAVTELMLIPAPATLLNINWQLLQAFVFSLNGGKYINTQIS